MLRSNQPEVWGIQKSHHLLLSHLIYSRELPWLSQIAVDTFWCNVANYCLIFWTSLAKSYKLCFMRPIGWWSEQLRTDGVCWTSSKYEHALAWHSFWLKFPVKVTYACPIMLFKCVCVSFVTGQSNAEALNYALYFVCITLWLFNYINLVYAIWLHLGLLVLSCYFIYVVILFYCYPNHIHFY